jgi:hypothetical protein
VAVASVAAFLLVACTADTSQTSPPPASPSEPSATMSPNESPAAPDIADEMTDAVGITAARRTYVADHDLNDEARAERDAWLSEVLGFAAPE